MIEPKFLKLSASKEHILLKKTPLTPESISLVCEFLVDVNASSERKRSDFVVERRHHFLRNIYSIDEFKVMKIDTTEKYSKIFERMLSLFLVVGIAFEDDIESTELKQFTEDDLGGLYNHVEEVKEYKVSIPVKKNSFCKVDYTNKILTFTFSELIKFEKTGKNKGVPM